MVDPALRDMFQPLKKAADVLSVSTSFTDAQNEKDLRTFLKFFMVHVSVQVPKWSLKNSCNFPDMRANHNKEQIF